MYEACFERINYFISAIVGSPFGLSGRVKISSLSGENSHFYNLKKVKLRFKKDFIEKEFIVEEVFDSPLSIKFAGIDSAEAAKMLTGAEVLVSREQAAPLNDGEFYIEDLKGMTVIFRDKAIGTIFDIIEGGGGFLAEILLETEEKRLVPFRDEFFGKIDLEQGCMELLHIWILE